MSTGLHTYQIVATDENGESLSFLVLAPDAEQAREIHRRHCLSEFSCEKPDVTTVWQLVLAPTGPGVFSYGEHFVEVPET